MNKRQLKEQRDVYKADAQRWQDRWWDEKDSCNILIMGKNATIRSLNKKIDELEDKNTMGKVTYLGEMKITTRDDEGNPIVDVVADFQSDEIALVNAWATSRRIENQDEKLTITKQTSVNVNSDGREPRSYAELYPYTLRGYANSYPSIFGSRYSY